MFLRSNLPRNMNLLHSYEIFVFKILAAFHILNKVSYPVFEENPTPVNNIKPKSNGLFSPGTALAEGCFPPTPSVKLDPGILES